MHYQQLRWRSSRQETVRSTVSTAMLLAAWMPLRWVWLIANCQLLFALSFPQPFPPAFLFLRFFVFFEYGFVGQAEEASGARTYRGHWLFFLDGNFVPAEDCHGCAFKPQCCPGNQQRGRGLLRLEESAAVLAFRKKMASTEAQKQYSRRGRVVEFCHAWIKSKLGLRQFHVRGLMKVRAELLWACLTYNLQHWIRLGKLKTSPALG